MQVGEGLELRPLLLVMCVLEAADETMRLHTSSRDQDPDRAQAVGCAQAIPDHPRLGPARNFPTSRRRRKASAAGLQNSYARSLREWLAKHEESIPRFMRKPDVRFTNIETKQKIMMAKVKTTVPGRFRPCLCAEVCCTISSYLSSKPSLGYNPLRYPDCACRKARRHDQSALPQSAPKRGKQSKTSTAYG